MTGASQVSIKESQHMGRGKAREEAAGEAEVCRMSKNFRMGKVYQEEETACAR